MDEENLERDGSASNVIAFPRPVKRGRKRVSRYVHTAGGDLALMLLTKDGEKQPGNVERLQLVKDRRDPTIDRWCGLFGRWDEAALLALSVYLALPSDARLAVHAHLRRAAFDEHDQADLRIAADSLLRRLPVPARTPNDGAA